MIKKIGFSASRCVHDIVSDKVSIEDVVMITTGTMCESLEQWIKVMEAYAEMDEWDQRSLAGLDIEAVRQVATELWESGKIHQPRNYGAYRRSSPWVWMDVVHTKEDRDSNPMLQKAWAQAQMIEAMVAPEKSQFDRREAEYEHVNDMINQIAQLTAEATDDLHEDKPSK